MNMIKKQVIVPKLPNITKKINYQRLQNMMVTLNSKYKKNYTIVMAPLKHK